MRPDNLYKLPVGLPVQEDDGATRHLVGRTLPPIPLPSTGGRVVRLDDTSIPLTVVYCYPRTGRPNEEAPGGTAQWNKIPGARGCTPQSCAYRDHYDELREMGALVYGISSQTTDYQREAVTRLHLPFELLSDADAAFSTALSLPTFEVTGNRLLKRATLIVEHGRIVKCFYLVFPPDQDAANVIKWLRNQLSKTTQD